MNVVNDLKYVVNVPYIRNRFENVKKEFYKNNKDSQDAVKDCKRKFPEYKSTEGIPGQAVQELLSKVFFVREENGGVYLKVKERLTLDLYLYVPRGINLEFKGMTLNADSKFEVANIFNIYGTEGFSLRLKTDMVNIVIEPASAAGVKGKTQVNLYSLEDNIVVKDDAEKYIECVGILKDYRG